MGTFANVVLDKEVKSREFKPNAPRAKK